MIGQEQYYVKESIFKAISEDASFELLIKHLPPGELLRAAYDKEKNLGKLIASLAVEFFKIELLAEKYSIDYDIDQAIELLDSWEKSIGLPTDCFSIRNKTIEERRVIIREIFGNFQGAQTREDFERVARLFGFKVVLPGRQIGADFPLQFPLMFFDSRRSFLHTIYVKFEGLLAEYTFPLPFPLPFEAQAEVEYFFPLPFPLPFSGGAAAFLKCLFELIAPANVNVIIQASKGIP